VHSPLKTGALAFNFGAGIYPPMETNYNNQINSIIELEKY
jgi:hypothetical protein